MQRTIATLITLGLVAGGLLLLIAAADFFHLGRWLAIPPVALFLTLLTVGAYNTGAIFAGATQFPSFPLRLTFTLVIPLVFLASALGCMGIELQGCTPACHWLTRAGIPLVAIISLTYLIFHQPWILLAQVIVCLSFLTPNCGCYNVINERWIDLLGASPACFSLAVTTSMVASAALYTGRAMLLAAATSWLATSLCAFFFIAHHYFRFPW